MGYYKTIMQMMKAALLSALLCAVVPFTVEAADKGTTANIVGATHAIGGSDFTAAAGVAGVQADANTTNFYVEGPSGTAGRYVDVFNKSIFIPLKTDMEANAFAQNVDPSQARVDLVRPKNTIGITDFSSGLSPASGIVANLRGTTTSATSTTVADIPRQRIDTSSVAGMQAFLNSNINTRSLSVGMTRKDCRLINYPDGTSETVCSPDTSWIENPTKRWTYQFNMRGISSSDNAQTVINKLTTPTPLAKQANLNVSTMGSWATDFLPATAPPSYSPPAIRSCGAHSNGQFWWDDVNTSTTLIACPAGQISDPSNPYRQTWTNQQQYQCYDGRTQNGAYPMPPTQVKPGSTQTLGNCLVVTSGQCSATYANQGWYSLGNSSALCSAGTTSGFAFNGSGWTWACLGQNGGSNVNCAATMAQSGQAGSANGGLFNSAPTSGLCGVGTPSAVSGSGEINDPWTWSCSGVNGGNATVGTANMRFHWVMDPWSTCSNNQQTRGVYCYDANNQWLPHTTYPNLDPTCTAHGAGDKPAYLQGCNSDTYHWEVDPWQGWSACDGGSQHRERGVYCRNQNGVTYGGDWGQACDYNQYPGWQQFQSCAMPVLSVTPVQVTAGWQAPAGNGVRYATATANCPAGYVLMGGGSTCMSGGGTPFVYLDQINGSGTGIDGGCGNIGSPGAGAGIQVTAYCGKWN